MELQQPTMRLILSSRHPRNSTYTSEGGAILYKVDKPLNFSGQGTATIRKAVGTVRGVWQGNTSSELDARAKSTLSEKDSTDARDKEGVVNSDRQSFDETFADSDSEDEPVGTSTRDLPVLEGHFAFYAQVEFHTFQSTRFRYNGLDVPVSDYFRKQGWSWFGRGRVFRASDGNEYRWELRAGHLEMIRNDGSKAQVVRFREWLPNLGPIYKGRPASLEIDPSCEPILDEVMMTFVYCHKLRKDRERRSRHQGGGGP